jgi:protein-S-isoprenylcysteine O-methyltransferase Ste14
MRRQDLHHRVRRIAAHGGIVLFLIMALEFVIMISPFAFFFYSVFNPVFQSLHAHAATRWLTAFFLPHMILPPTAFLQAVRILGSVLLVAGAAMFLVCAGRVYAGKVLGWGPAEKGFYRALRHPQYTGLAVLGLGLAVLWPRFIVLAMLGIMLVLYYFLARNEEERMLARYGEGYAEYLRRTGMFVPRRLESKLLPARTLLPSGAFGVLLGSAATIALLVGAGFVMREITLRSLPMSSADNVTLVAILPEDADRQVSALQGVAAYMAGDEGAILSPSKDYLGYVMPGDYIMQGMIADTGQQSQLHKHHHTRTLIVDWVLHPFAHLRRPPSAYMARMHGVDPAVARRHHCPMGIDDRSSVRPVPIDG